MRFLNTAVRCTVLTFVFIAAIVSIAGLTQSPQKSRPDAYAVDEKPAEKNLTTSQETLQADLGNSG